MSDSFSLLGNSIWRENEEKKKRKGRIVEILTCEMHNFFFTETQRDWSHLVQRLCLFPSNILVRLLEKYETTCLWRWRLKRVRDTSIYRIYDILVLVWVYTSISSCYFCILVRVHVGKVWHIIVSCPLSVFLQLFVGGTWQPVCPCLFPAFQFWCYQDSNNPMQSIDCYQSLFLMHSLRVTPLSSYSLRKPIKMKDIRTNLLPHQSLIYSAQRR